MGGVSLPFAMLSASGASFSLSCSDAHLGAARLSEALEGHLAVLALLIGEPVNVRIDDYDDPRRTLHNLFDDAFLLRAAAESESEQVRPVFLDVLASLLNTSRPHNGARLFSCPPLVAFSVAVQQQLATLCRAIATVRSALAVSTLPEHLALGTKERHLALCELWALRSLRLDPVLPCEGVDQESATANALQAADLFVTARLTLIKDCGHDCPWSE